MSWTRERARIASLTRSRQPDDPELVEAYKNLRYERARLAIAQIAAAELSDEQRTTLAGLLAGGEPQ